MDIACWNCKTVTKLDKAAIEAAIAQMDSTKVGFYDVACASCGKSNRTTRDVFTAALTALQTPQLSEREIKMQAKAARAAKEEAGREKDAIKAAVRQKAEKKAGKKG